MALLSNGNRWNKRGEGHPGEPSLTAITDTCGDLIKVEIFTDRGNVEYDMSERK